MDKTNNLSDTIVQTNLTSDFAGNSPSISNEGEGFFDSLKNINVTTWLLIILILAFLGFNIFVYLAKGTQDITNFFGPVAEKLFGASVGVTGQTVDVAAEGAKAVVGGTAATVKTGLTAVQDITPNSANTSITSQPIQNIPPAQIDNTSLNKAINTASQNQNENQQDYQAHEAQSSIHSAGKTGWCFIGEDRGFRSCAQVGADDICMSGDIFPTQELCINPNLRK